MLKRLALLITVCAISGCSEPEPVEIDIDEIAAEAGLSEDEYSIDENGIMTIHVKSDDQPEKDVVWYQDDLSEPIENVGMSDGDAIIASAGLKPEEVHESIDLNGKPHKRYDMSIDNPIHAWMSHSSNNISLNWFQYNFPNEPEHIEPSQQSLKDAYKIARAMAGKEGADAVRYISSGSGDISKPIGGHHAEGYCHNGLCSINIRLGNS